MTRRPGGPYRRPAARGPVQLKPAQRRKAADSNREAAALILSDIDQHGGEQAGLVVWARKIQSAAPQVADSKSQGTTNARF